MLEQLNSICVSLIDLLLGWLLYLPTDLSLLFVALISSAILVFLRLLVTDQDLLTRAANDRKRLTLLIKDARKKKDKAAAKRCAATRTLVRLATLKSELYALLAVIIPIAILATWCFARLAYHPPRENDPIEIVAYTPVSAIGKVMHIVPQDGLRCEQWIAEVVPDKAGPAGQELQESAAVNGIATWKITAAVSDEPHKLLLRYKDKTLEHSLLVGGRTYQQDIIKYHAPQWITQIDLKPVKLLGVVPGLPWLMLPPWVVAYLILVIPLSLFVKRILGIY
jgi:uncharacterized membrane protein (DUF106 family)